MYTPCFISRVFVIRTKKTYLCSCYYFRTAETIFVAIHELYMHVVRGCSIKEGAFIIPILKQQIGIHSYCCWHIDVSRIVIIMDGVEPKSALMPL